MTPVHTCAACGSARFTACATGCCAPHYRDANLPQLFQIMDTQDQLALIKRLYKAHGIDDERFPQRQLQYFISGAKEEGLRPNQVEAGDELTRPPGRALRALRGDVPARRRRRFRRAPAAQLRAPRAARRRCASITSAASRTCSSTSSRTRTCCSIKWLKLLAGEHAAVFAVGDDDQSIYAFRGANVANMQHFERDFARAEHAGRAHQARAELPLARQHPRRRQRAHQAQPDAARQEPVDERRQGRARARAGGAFGSSTRRRSSST